MFIFAHPRFLSRVMWLDAASCLGCGALQLAATDAMARLTGLSAGLLTATGWFLLAYALGAALMASRTVPPRLLIGLVAGGNVLWALGCVAVAFSGASGLAGPGLAWLGLQAVSVLVLAELQWTGLRRSRRVTGLASA